MARLIDADSEYLRNTSPTAMNAAVGTFVMWVYPLNSQDDSAYHWYFECGITPDGYDQFQVSKYSNNNLYVGWYSQTEQRIGINAGDYVLTQNAWNQIVYRYTSGGLAELILNYALIGTRNPTTPSTVAPTQVGVGIDYAGSGRNSNARISRVSHWNRLLTNNEIFRLIHGQDPEDFSGLVFNFPLLGDESPEPDTEGGTSLTLTGSPTKADDYSLFTPSTDYRINQFLGEAIIEPPAKSVDYMPVFSRILSMQK